MNRQLHHNLFDTFLYNPLTPFLKGDLKSCTCHPRSYMVISDKSYYLSHVSSFISRIFPLLLIFFALLSFSSVVYCATENDRQAISQRARVELEEILSTEEFKAQTPQPPWWSQWVERLLRRLPDGVGWAGTLLEWTLYFVAVLAIASICVFIARRFRRSPSFTTNYSIPVESEHHTDPEAVKNQAHECFQRGEYRQAIRYLYLSLLLHLDKTGLLKYDIAKTNGEYLGEVRVSMTSKVDRFASLTRLFEQKWYGMEESSAGDFQQCEETFVELIGPQTNRLID